MSLKTNLQLALENAERASEGILMGGRNCSEWFAILTKSSPNKNTTTWYKCRPSHLFNGTSCIPDFQCLGFEQEETVTPRLVKCFIAGMIVCGTCILINCRHTTKIFCLASLLGFLFAFADIVTGYKLIFDTAEFRYADVVAKGSLLFLHGASLVRLIFSWFEPNNQQRDHPAASVEPPSAPVHVQPIVPPSSHEVPYEMATIERNIQVKLCNDEALIVKQLSDLGEAENERKERVKSMARWQQVMNKSKIEKDEQEYDRKRKELSDRRNTFENKGQRKTYKLCLEIRYPSVECLTNFRKTVEQKFGGPMLLSVGVRAITFDVAFDEYFRHDITAQMFPKDEKFPVVVMKMTLSTTLKHGMLFSRSHVYPMPTNLKYLK